MGARRRYLVRSTITESTDLLRKYRVCLRSPGVRCRWRGGAITAAVGSQSLTYIASIDGEVRFVLVGG